MSVRFYTPVYAITLLLSAALLFSVQPLFSKMILPLLGGTPQVWNTAMLFFQLMLLGGYAYAHGTSRFLSIRVQACVHIVLLLLFIVVLPLSIPIDWLPPVDQDPTLWQLSVMFMTVGGPFFVLAGSAPMLQHWFSDTDHPDSDNPYFLYGASNLGSMTSLLAYPVLIEPLLTLNSQSWVWALGYGGLILMTALSAALVWRQKQKSVKPSKPANDHAIDWSLRIRWLILAFIPSSLMLGVTTYITTDIASVPLLWIMPLALYVGTFILVFARKPLIHKPVINALFFIFLCLFLVQMIGFTHSSLDPFLLMGLHLGLFFFAALMCHQELADSRPSASHLTEFYLVMSIGGAIGGFFNAIIAPNFFIVPIEYALALVAACFMRFSTTNTQMLSARIDGWKTHFHDRGVDGFFTLNSVLIGVIVIAAVFAFGFQNLNVHYACVFVICLCLLGLYKQRWHFAGAFAILVFFFPPGFFWGYHDFKDVVFQDRNFFGVIKVVDNVSGERQLLHGTTNHGAQALNDKYKLEPLSYYSYESPIRDTFRSLDRRRGEQKVAIVGLGIGVTACFQKDERHFDFYEIDPEIVAVAENEELFTYLSDCGSPYETILGDGRLTIQNKPDDHYDLIVLDAFSSDNVPVHLLTLEAIQIYLSKLKPDGILTFNVSNNYIDLEPVLALAAQEIQIPAYSHATNGGEIEGTDLKFYPAHFVAMTYSQDHMRILKQEGWSQAVFRDGVRLWTDQYSNIVSVLGNETGIERVKKLVQEEDVTSSP